MMKILSTFIIIGAIIMNIDDAISSENEIKKTAYDFSFTSINGNKKLSLRDLFF